MQFAEGAGQHAVLRHGQRQARITHHQRVEHSKSADHSSERESNAKQRAAEQAGDVGPESSLPSARGKSSHPHRGYWHDVAQSHDRNRNQHGAGISPLRTLHFRCDSRRIVPSHVIPHANEQTRKDVYRRSCRFGHNMGERSELERRNGYDEKERRREHEEKPQRSRRNYADTGNIQQRADHDYRKSDCPAAISHREPRKESREVKHKQCRINRHVKNRRHQREPSFLKSPEVAHGAAYPRVVAALEWQSTRQFANHECGGKAPEDRSQEQNQNGLTIASAVHDIFCAIGSARYHKEGSGDEWPESQANGFFPVRGDHGGLECLARCASGCQFLCTPPLGRITLSHPVA